MTDKKRKTYRQSKYRAYITSGVGIVAIAGLIYAGIAFNEEPNLKIEMSPSPTTMVPPQGSFAELDPTRKPTKAPDKKPTHSLSKPTSAAPTGSADKAPDNTKPTNKPDKTPTEAAKPTKSPSNQTVETGADAMASLKFPGEQSLNWPVLGNVLMPYSMEHIIYHKTLNTFRVNDGVLLSAKEGESVVAAADGIVTEVVKDDMRGNCVSIAMGDGYTMLYGQLKESKLKVGDSVKEGDPVGEVAVPTRYYSLEGTHLFLKLTKDGNPVNPLLYLRANEEDEDPADRKQ